MKKIFILLAAMLLSAVNETKAQGNMTLTKRHEALAAMAANAAQGDTESLKRAADEGFDNGLTISEAKEALSHLYAYTGFPRSLNAQTSARSRAKPPRQAGRQTPCPQATTL